MAPRHLEKAARPGRMRGVATEVMARALAAPERAAAVLREGLRRARMLHSRERRLVADGLRGMIRRRGLLRAALQTDDVDAHWLGWLVLEGLDPAVADAQHPVDFGPLRDPAAALEGLEGAARLAVVASVPHHAATALLADLGDAAEAFVEASNARAPVVLRANRLRTDREALIARLADEGVAARPAVRAPDGVVLEGRANLQGLGSFRAGWFEIQDEASQLVAAQVETTGVVLDLCAGAGGKTLALAARRPARLVAHDIRARALRELERRAARAGAQVEIGTVPVADAVLVDAPCSGTGVWRRHPEYRWRMTPERLADLARTQDALIRDGAARVRPGGQLVYATCSVLRRENEEVVDRFLEGTSGFETERVTRWAPHTSNTDGFFAAWLRRR